MTTANSSLQKRPRKLWWLVGVVMFVLCVMLQMPAAWVLQKYAPNSPYVKQVSGNLWQGSAILQLPSMAAKPSKSGFSGAVQWQWQPWKLFLGQLGSDIILTSGKSKLEGEMSLHRNGWSVQNIQGKITQDTLQQVVDWQLPDAPIQVNSVSLKRVSSNNDKQSGFIKADGQLTWVGGALGYPSGAKTFQITLPAMRADFSTEQKGDMNLLHASLLDSQDKRLGDLYLDANNMLDVNLTQRLLENMPEYQGQAPKDTPVVSVRQPLFSGIAGMQPAKASLAGMEAN